MPEQSLSRLNCKYVEQLYTYYGQSTLHLPTHHHSGPRDQNGRASDNILIPFPVAIARLELRRYLVPIYNGMS